MFENSVTRLRDEQRQRSRREFLARGSKLSRCEQCLLATRLCMCQQRPEPVDGVAVCLIYYQGEVFKPSNTGRLVADVLADNYAYQWSRTDPDSDMLALLSDPGYAPLLVFPYEYAETERHCRSPRVLDRYLEGKVPLLVLLDGTWREARKMFRSPWLTSLPVIAVEPVALSEYRLRVAAQDHQLGTAEVVIPLLSRLGFDDAAQRLEGYFTVFRGNYLAGRSNRFPSESSRAPED
ncbi:MAG: DTW domain-containing protein [Pseudomonadota bacterium]|nr:DTW domain-containing protein [Pseudomonadota bacterium]MEC8524908.1 DTW domain-containing protein [Pseudomonadota bacterium]